MFSWTSEVFQPGSALYVAAILMLLSWGSAALLMALVLTLRLLDLRDRRRRADAMRRWRPALLGVAAGATVQAPKVQPHDGLGLLLLWNQLQDSLRGESHDALDAVAESIGLHRHARRYVKSWHAGHRLVGLRTLAHLAHPADWDRVAARLDDRRPQVSLAAARAMLRIDAVRAVGPVLDQFLLRSDWPVPHVVWMLSEVGREHVGPAIESRLRRAPPAIQLRLVPLASLTYGEEAPLLVEDVLRTVEEPALLCALLARVRDPSARARVRELCSHKAASVRAYAAATLGRLGAGRDRTRLVAMLGDDDWWVRYRAAQALSRLPNVGHLGLMALADALADARAQAIVRHVAAERFGPVPT